MAAQIHEVALLEGAPIATHTCISLPKSKVPLPSTDGPLLVGASQELADCQSPIFCLSFDPPFLTDFKSCGPDRKTSLYLVRWLAS